MATDLIAIGREARRECGHEPPGVVSCRAGCRHRPAQRVPKMGGCASDPASGPQGDASCCSPREASVVLPERTPGSDPDRAELARWNVAALQEVIGSAHRFADVLSDRRDTPERILRERASLIIAQPGTVAAHA